jgi:hypothetical protein
MTRPISWYARRYVERFGMALVPVDPMSKFPSATDWGNRVITDPDQAEAFYTKHPDWNMGAALYQSRLCSLDIDCAESFAEILAEYGIDDDLTKYPTIQGRDKGSRIMFRVPEGVSLPYQKLNWPVKDGSKQYTVFELRSATDGKARQDVLPPSTHPDTGKPYKWITQPVDKWPEPPAWLMAMWQAWDKFKPQLQAACPWAEKPQTSRVPAQRQHSDGVIQQFNDAHDIRQMLEHYGYQRKGRTRYLSPHTTTKLPGVVIFPDGNAAWCHHASDPLCSDDSGHPIAPFDLFCYYEHGNDPKRACKAARDVLGIPATQVPVAQQTSQNVNACDYYSPLPYATDRGKPLKHIDNLREVCRRLQVTIRYNVISKEEEILIPNQSFSIDNQANASMAWLTSECSRFDLATDKLGEFITYIADQNLFNPVARWLESKPWDGKDRLSELLDTVTAKDKHELKNTLIKRWMIAAVASVYLPDGISAPGVLVFQGEQYLGKTMWFKKLVPEHLGLVKDGMLLRPDDKDSVKQACSFWLVELGELDSTFRKADIAQLKSFITSNRDVLRRAYARRESHFARRTMFFGSVNPREFLHDPTGNRRYWTIECAHLDHSHTIDMQQVWAQVLDLWRGGEGYYLDSDEVAELNSHNEEFMAIDPTEERILTRFDWKASEFEWTWMTATDALIAAGVDRPTRADATTASVIIRKRNDGKARRSNGKNLLLLPPVHR